VLSALQRELDERTAQLSASEQSAREAAERCDRHEERGAYLETALESAKMAKQSAEAALERLMRSSATQERALEIAQNEIKQLKRALAEFEGQSDSPADGGAASTGAQAAEMRALRDEQRRLLAAVKKATNELEAERALRTKSEQRLLLFERSNERLRREAEELRAGRAEKEKAGGKAAEDDEKSKEKRRSGRASSRGSREWRVAASSSGGGGGADEGVAV
jgi:hypothetical protein